MGLAESLKANQGKLDLGSSFFDFPSSKIQQRRASEEKHINVNLRHCVCTDLYISRHNFAIAAASIFLSLSLFLKFLSRYVILIS
jgi:hypothetical protein